MNYTWNNLDHTHIDLEENGVTITFPATSSSPYYVDMTEQGIQPKEYSAPVQPVLTTEEKVNHLL